jgi:serine/threonine protein phosphatase PrpC
MTAFISDKSSQYKFKIGTYSNIGGSSTQQDRIMTCQTLDGSNLLAVADGHGRDDGEIFAQTTIDQIESIAKSTDFSSLSPEEIVQTLIKMFNDVNEACKQSIMRSYMERNYEIMETDDGVLLKRRNMQSWMFVDGGTTCTVLVCIRDKIYSAIVGDSSAKLFTPVAVLHRSQVKICIDSADIDRNIESRAQPSSDEELVTHIELTESPPLTDETEYRRVTSLEKHFEFVYDTPGMEKQRCPKIFSVGTNGELIRRKKFSYCKNVNREPATYAVSPYDYNFGLSEQVQRINEPCVLAMSRSIGDFPLKPLGVVCQPIITVLEIQPLFEKMKGICEDPKIELVIGSDGLWDNFREFDNESDMSVFLQDSNNFQSSGTHDAQLVATTLGDENERRGIANFGRARDNTTIIVMRIIESN